MAFVVGHRSAEAGSASAERQLTQLLAGPSAASELHLTSIVRQLTAPVSDPSASASHNAAAIEWHKLLVRIQSLLQSQQDVQLGLQLANEILRSAPWDAYAASCSDWIGAALSNFDPAVTEAIDLLDTLLGMDARQRPEYWRSVGSSAAQKYAMLLIEYAERTSARPTTIKVLDALGGQIQLHPTSFRTHAPRIHKLCMHLLFDSQSYILQATNILAKLPLTGKGREGQAELWSTTALLLLREARKAWHTCCSTFVDLGGAERESPSVFTQPVPTDDVEALRVAHHRLALLLGSAPRPGILPAFLGEPSANAVPLPLDDLLDLAHSILTILPSSPCQLDYTPEATLHATQAALLPQAHLCAISFLAAMPHDVWRPRHAETARRLLTQVEKGSPAIRCASLQALASMRLPLDPHGSVLVRSVRTCLAQLSRLVNQDVEAIDADSRGGDRSSGTASGGGRANKKRRVYESDQVLLPPLRGFVELEDDEYAACMAASELLGTFYHYLITFITPELHDLAQTGALLMLGLVEIALKEPDELTARLVQTLGRLISVSRGQMLGLLTVRASSLCAQALVSLDEQTRSAAEALQIALCDTFHPKLPPKLALRLHVEQDRMDVHADDSKQLDEVVLDEDRGTSERVALQEVLEIGEGRSADQLDGDHHLAVPFHSWSAGADVARPAGSIAGKGRTSLLANGNVPREGALNATYSPDPVKPTRRPSTPRIGSPNPSSGGAGTTRRHSLSPDRPMGGAALTAASAHDGTLSSRDASPPAPSSSTAAVPASTTTTVTTTTTKLQQRAPTSPLAKESSRHDAAQTLVYEDYDDNEDSDGSLPEIDMRSSGEESGDDEADG